MRRLWRYVKTPLVLGSLLVFMFFGFKWAVTELNTPMPPRPRTPCVTMSVGKSLEPWRVSVSVLNGGSRSGLANRQATTLRHAGFSIVKVGNTKERVRKTTIVGQDITNPEVVLVASYFVDPVLVADDRADHSVDVLVGNDFGGTADRPLKSVPVQGGKVCLPQDSPTSPPPGP